MATIREVAESAGVSYATVSHVINNTRVVSQETRQRVLAAMTALNYRPNALARSLRQGKTNTIGLVLPDSANPFFAEISRVHFQECLARIQSDQRADDRPKLGRRKLREV